MSEIIVMSIFVLLPLAFGISLITSIRLNRVYKDPNTEAATLDLASHKLKLSIFLTIACAALIGFVIFYIALIASTGVHC